VSAVCGLFGQFFTELRLPAEKLRDWLSGKF